MSSTYEPIGEESTGRKRVLAGLAAAALVSLGVGAVLVPGSPFAMSRGISALEAVEAIKEFKSVAYDPATFAKLKAVTYSDLTEKDKKALFETFQTQYDKTYDSTKESNDRFAIFSKNLGYIDALNTQNPHALFGLNVFADQTEEERSKRRMTDPSVTNYTRVKQELKKMINPIVFEKAEAGADSPATITAALGAVSPAPGVAASPGPRRSVDM